MKINMRLIPSLWIVTNLVCCWTLFSQSQETNDASLLYKNAQEMEQEGNFKEAIRLYREALSKSQDISLRKIVLQLLGQMYERQKEYSDALLTYQEYLKLVTDSPLEKAKGESKIAYVYIQQGDYSKGLAIFDNIIEANPNTQMAADAQFSKATVYHHTTKDYAKAIEEYRKMIKEYPSDWRVSSPICQDKIASCLARSGKYADAIAQYQQISKIYPNTIQARTANMNIRVINEYLKKGKEPSPEEMKRIMQEEGFGDGVITDK